MLVQPCFKSFPCLFAVGFGVAAAAAQDANCLCADWRNSHPEWIWCDDFENDTPMDQKYFEYDSDQGDFIVLDGVGVNESRALRARYQQGEVSAGSFKKSFGRTPSNYIGRHAARPEEDFNEIYWRMDVRRQPGWTGGGGAKLTRAMVLANNNWAQGLIAHLWSSGPGGVYLAMDPASGINSEGNLQSTKYNDFDNLRWLGLRRSTVPLFSEDNADRWFCIEAHVKINTPGKSDGIFEFWIDGQLQASRNDLNWHGNWNEDPDHYMINAVFFSNYWNDGSPKEQERYLDNLVISTSRIGCDCTDSDAARSDADQDGVPDDYESRYGVFEMGSDDRSRDSDQDGMSNADEYWAGTSADDADSNLRILQPVLSGETIRFSFRTVESRRYTVEVLNEAQADGWSKANFPEIIGDGADGRVEIPASNHDVRFFRIKVDEKS